MLEVTGVLNGHKGVDQTLRHVGIGDVDSVFLAQHGDFIALRVIDQGCFCALEVFRVKDDV